MTNENKNRSSNPDQLQRPRTDTGKDSTIKDQHGRVVQGNKTEGASPAAAGRDAQAKGKWPSTQNDGSVDSDKADSLETGTDADVDSDAPTSKKQFETDPDADEVDIGADDEITPPGRDQQAKSRQTTRPNDAPE